MEGRHSRWSSQPRPRDLLRKIREFALAMIEDLSNGRSPEIFIDRFRNYCTNPDSNCYCSFDSPKGQEILTLRRTSHGFVDYSATSARKQTWI
ncbi:hypothetical protein ACFX12_030367 [Malus domestica]